MKEYRIEEYGLIGNCETSALINPEGGIDWLCLPAFDGGSFFGALLDREKGGEFFIRPTEKYRVERRYLDDSALLETRFQTANGTVVLTDFFVVARTEKARFYDFTSLHATCKLVRSVRVEPGGPVSLQFSVRARPDYGRVKPDWKAIPGGFEVGEAAIFSSVPLKVVGGDLFAEIPLEPGVPHFVVLDYGKQRRRPATSDIACWQEVTEAFWREWNLFNYYRGPHYDVVRRSAVTLKLLTYAPSGAFVAAPTTSLPEIPGGESNWDYRYTWLRDTGLLIDTLFRIGYSGEAQAFLRFIVRQMDEGDGASNPPGLLHAIRGGEVPAEEELEHLGGYGGARPVRTGNRAKDQPQLDTFAHVLEAFFYFRHTGGKLTREMRALVEASVEALLARWQEPDNGVWETVERRRYTYGKVMAWIGLGAGSKLSKKRRTELSKVRAEIHHQVLEAGLQRENGFLASEYHGSEIDASSLLAFTSDFLTSDLARATRERVELELAQSALVFRNESQRAQGEGAFLLCSFWLVNHL
ncbi:MAG: glycoside hydrolase family 15 protein, partial [Verrucomicrobiota bacterium]|nr:glycoside hydrolase family 15 protein [Verrucomicrobiota bacterium]